MPRPSGTSRHRVTCRSIFSTAGFRATAHPGSFRALSCSTLLAPAQTLPITPRWPCPFPVETVVPLVPVTPLPKATADDTRLRILTSGTSAVARGPLMLFGAVASLCNHPGGSRSSWTSGYFPTCSRQCEGCSTRSRRSRYHPLGIVRPRQTLRGYLNAEQAFLCRDKPRH